jgi:hypothetical protein
VVTQAPTLMPPTTLEIRSDPLAALFVAYSLSLALEEQGDPAAAISALARVSDQVEVETDPADHEVADG